MGFKPNSTSHPVDVFLKLTPVIAWVATLALLAGTLAYWGGARPEKSFVFFYLGAALWLNLAFHALLTWLAGRRIGTWLDLTVLAFLAYFLWWYGHAPIPFLARWEGLWIGCYAAVFLNIRYVFPSRSWGIAILIAIVLLGVIQAGFGLSKLGQHAYELWGENRPDYGQRISGFFGCPNHYGNFLVMATLTATVLGTMRSFSWIFRILFFYAALMMSVAVIFSISRGSYLAWLTGFGVLGLFWVWGFRHSPWARWLVAAGGVAALGAAGFGFWWYSHVSRSASLFEDNFRSFLFRDAWNIFLKQPIFGFGPATFDYIHQRFHGPEFQSRAFYVHNDYLNTLTDYGAVGLILVGLFVLLLLLSFRPPGDSTSTERQVDLAALGCAVVAACLLHAVVDFNFHIPACALTFFTIVGVASCRTERQQRAPICLPGNAVFIVVGLLAPVLIVMTALPPQRAWSLMHYRSAALSELSPERLNLLADRVAQTDPKAAPLFVRLGDALRSHLSKLDDEVEDLKRAVVQGKAEPSLLTEKAEARQEMGEQALKIYDRAQAGNPLDDTILIKKGMVLDLMGRSDEAFLLYSKAMTNQEHNRFFTYILAYHFWRQGLLTQAREAFQETLRIPQGKRERNRAILDQSRQAIQAIEADLRAQEAAKAPTP
jgi:O-antigen ligase